MATTKYSKLAALESFLLEHPHIAYATPSSSNYTSLRVTYNLDNHAVPLAIVRPQTAEEVAILVKYATSHAIEFVVRSGGHSLFGKSQVQDALTIDMRDIHYVKVDDKKSSAKIGGGILLLELATQLAKEGLATPIGNMPSIGYVGWAIYGGYGPFSANFGLGVDNILGAKVVNWKGEVVDADPRMLKGIRGAGGNFGIIVELAIRVYPLRKILTGMILYDSENFTATFQKFNAGYEALSANALPPQLSVSQMAGNFPLGICLGIQFMWSSDDEELGRVHLADIESLGDVVVSTVASTTIPEWLITSEALLPSAVNIERLPSDQGTIFIINQLRGLSTSPMKASVFASREPHYVLEFVGTTIKQEAAKESLEWASRSVEELRRTDPENILPGTYISLDPPGHTSLSTIFGSDCEYLLALKREQDPKNVFNLAVPTFKDF